MNIRVFNKKYWLRQFGEQKEIRGYLTSPFRDIVVSIHVHPTGTDTTQTLPEGERRIKRLEGHGEVKLNVANELDNTKADLLLYQGEWYQCLSCQLWDHTLLSHYNYQFVLVPRDGGRAIDISNIPTIDPSVWKGAE